MATNCLFCNLRTFDYYQTLKLFENKHFFAIFDPHPVSPGHALIIPKKHSVSLLDLNKEQWNYLKPSISATIKIIERIDFKGLYIQMIDDKPTKKSSSFCKKMLLNPNINKKPEGYNIGNNEGKVAGRTIHHLHIQIIPRYKGDVKNPTGGIRTIIPELGDYKS
ncbi:MAG: HIT family protein [Nanoarchaeota archaeon]|nr:HIT family protein [Nanoarchaeota archaeon]MBU1854420.1 HIT family protein [Nanoarchaeota archaeon]